MTTESYSVYSVSLDLLESDGYGPLDHISETRLVDALRAGSPAPSRLSTEAFVETDAPLILMPYLDYILILDDCFTSNKSRWVGENFSEVSIGFSHGDQMRYF